MGVFNLAGLTGQRWSKNNADQRPEKKISSSMRRWRQQQRARQRSSVAVRSCFLISRRLWQRTSARLLLVCHLQTRGTPQAATCEKFRRLDRPWLNSLRRRDSAVCPPRIWCQNSCCRPFTGGVHYLWGGLVDIWSVYCRALCLWTTRLSSFIATVVTAVKYDSCERGRHTSSPAFKQVVNKPFVSLLTENFEGDTGYSA